VVLGTAASNWHTTIASDERRVYIISPSATLATTNSTSVTPNQTQAPTVGNWQPTASNVVQPFRDK